MKTESIDPRELASDLAAAMPALDEREQRIAISLYRLLLIEGEPPEANDGALMDVDARPIRQQFSDLLVA